jgi:hypothetical protein
LGGILGVLTVRVARRVIAATVKWTLPSYNFTRTGCISNDPTEKGRFVQSMGWPPDNNRSHSNSGGAAQMGRLCTWAPSTFAIKSQSILTRPTWPFLSASSFWTCSVGKNSGVVMNTVQVSQIVSYSHGIFLGRVQ